MGSEEAWRTLGAAGVPLGLRSGVGRFDDGQVTQALAVVRGRTNSDEAPLLAWLWALRSHWADKFTALGLEGDFVAVKARCTDWNRVLKLRRIALSRLAEMI